ncbi:9515_t:CDS:2, partial [Cetraspora pellucida]
MSRRVRQNTNHGRPDSSFISQETVESSETSSAQVQESQNVEVEIDQQTRAYINMMIQATAARFEQLEQMNFQNKENINSVQGNYPPTPIINDLIMQKPENQRNERQTEKEPLKYK